MVSGTAEALNKLSRESKDASENLDEVWYSSENVRDGLLAARIVAGQVGIAIKVSAKMGEVALLALVHMINNVVISAIVGVAKAVEWLANKVLGKMTEEIRGMLDVGRQPFGLWQVGKRPKGFQQEFGSHCEP